LNHKPRYIKTKKNFFISFFNRIQEKEEKKKERERERGRKGRGRGGRGRGKREKRRKGKEYFKLILPHHFSRRELVTNF
jgi:hypothetical protein